MRAIEFLNSGADTYLKYLCGLQYNATAARARLSKIICTMGPASRSPDTLQKLMSKGMNIARLNFSHGSHEFHAESISIVRQAVRDYSSCLSFEHPVGIALDTKGPEIRTGLIDGSATGEVELKVGETIKFSPDDQYREKSSREVLYVDYANILKLIQPGNRVYIDDGLISVLVEKVEGDMVICKIENAGKLGSKKGVNLPDVPVDLPAVSEQDKKDLNFGAEQGVDMVFASFIRNAQALHEIREVLGSKGEHIKIISKIESHEGMQNIDEIIDASDGVMVARGDLGIEIPTEMVFVAQKTIIARCNRAGKPVICATQMLESMTKVPRPTRAEASDVANAIIDGADCVMLSGETAKGSYPSECVNTMSNICKQAECVIWYREHFNELTHSATNLCMNAEHAMAIAVVQASFRISATAIVVVTTTGDSAYYISRYRPRCPILMVTDCKQTARQAQLYRGILPYIYEEHEKDSPDIELAARVDFVLECALKQSLVECGDPVIVLVPPETESGFEDNMSIETIA